MQYQKLIKFIGDMLNYENLPIIVAGDFNDWSNQSSSFFENILGIQEVYRRIHGHFAKTFPATFPLLCLDRIYVKGFIVLNSTVIKTDLSHSLSDHLPLFSEVEFYEK